MYLPQKATADIINYAWQLKRNGRAESTITTTTARLTRLNKLCNIYNPEKVKDVLATLNWKNSTKDTTVILYNGFVKHIGQTWEKPRYRRETTIPFIPTEKEIDTLISGASPRIATLLQIPKETGARIGEVDTAKWTDIDLERQTINIHAEKNSNPRILPISKKLVAMLNNLPRTNDDVFQTKKHGLRRTYEGLRKRMATKLNNPRLKKITFHTFRHWKATMEYHNTKDIIHVMKTLGHKNIKNTLIYINTESAIFLSNNDEWICKIATNTDEAKTLIEVGFEYITEKDGKMLFRKRK